MHAWFFRSDLSGFVWTMASSAAWMLWILSAAFTSPENAALRVLMRDTSLDVVRGDLVILPCSFFTSSHLSRLNIIWTMAPLSSPESPIQVIVFDHGQVIENPSLISRVAFTGAKLGSSTYAFILVTTGLSDITTFYLLMTGLPVSADIVLNDTRVSDAGVYRCMVNNPPEAADPGIGEVVLNVLEPPSLPICQWDGDLELGGSVRLSCSVAEGVPAPDIRWSKMDPEEIPLPVNREGEFSGSVRIVNVSSQMSGLYRCSASNILGTENCYINLSIYSTPDGPSGLLQAVLLTLTMSLMLLALMMLILWLHRTGQDGRRRGRKEEEEECYNEIRYTPSLMKRSFV